MRWLFIRSYKSYNRAFSRAWYHYTPIKFFCKCRYFHIVRLLDYSVCSIVCSMRKAVPYLFGALYLQKSHKQCQLWLAALAILIPSVVEKAAIYLFGAYLYNLRPINVVGVMEAIKSNAPYTNFIKNQSAQNLINLSYFNWTYILCSIAISVLVILLLHKTKQKSNKG